MTIMQYKLNYQISLQVWFKNRRAKHRKHQKATSLTHCYRHVQCSSVSGCIPWPTLPSIWPNPPHPCTTQKLFSTACTWNPSLFGQSAFSGLQHIGAHNPLCSVNNQKCSDACKHLFATSSEGLLCKPQEPSSRLLLEKQEAGNDGQFRKNSINALRRKASFYSLSGDSAKD